MNIGMEVGDVVEIIVVIASFVVALIIYLKFVNSDTTFYYRGINHMFGGCALLRRLELLLEEELPFNIEKMKQTLKREFSKDLRVFSGKIVVMIMSQLFINIVFYFILFSLKNVNIQAWLQSYIFVASVVFALLWIKLTKRELRHKSTFVRILLIVSVPAIVSATSYYSTDYVNKLALMLYPLAFFFIGFVAVSTRGLSIVTRRHIRRLYITYKLGIRLKRKGQLLS